MPIKIPKVKINGEGLGEDIGRADQWADWDQDHPPAGGLYPIVLR